MADEWSSVKSAQAVSHQCAGGHFALYTAQLCSKYSNIQIKLYNIKDLSPTVVAGKVQCCAKMMVDSRQ